MTRRANAKRVIARFDRDRAFAMGIAALDDDHHAAVMDDAEDALRREIQLQAQGDIPDTVGAPAIRRRTRTGRGMVEGA